MFNYKKNIDFKNDKTYLYEEIGDINNKNNNKNQHVGELEDNRQNVINNNFGGINENFLNNILKNNKKREKKGYNPHKNNDITNNKIENEGNNSIFNEKRENNIHQNHSNSNKNKIFKTTDDNKSNN